jgi:phosphopantetheinyl transferase
MLWLTDHQKLKVKSLDQFLRAERKEAERLRKLRKQNKIRKRKMKLMMQQILKELLRLALKLSSSAVHFKSFLTLLSQCQSFI